jgi:shikimate kinase
VTLKARGRLIILLVGPKGAGKSHVGREIRNVFGVTFLRVEGIWQKLKSERSDSNWADYLRTGKMRCVEAIKPEPSTTGSVVVESTGFQDAFDDYVAEMRAMAQVILVRIQAKPQTCLERVKTRDQSLHLNVSDEMVSSINLKSEILVRDCDIVLNNDQFLSAAAIDEGLSGLIFGAKSTS